MTEPERRSCLPQSSHVETRVSRDQDRLFGPLTLPTSEYRLDEIDQIVLSLTAQMPRIRRIVADFDVVAWLTPILRVCGQAGGVPQKGSCSLTSVSRSRFLVLMGHFATHILTRICPDVVSNAATTS